MPDEEIDKLIQDAAGQHHPPYDDKAWGRMELLLNKHLPQKKDRRKYILFTLFFLLIGVAGFFAVESLLNKKTTIAANSKENESTNTVNPNSANTAKNNTADVISNTTTISLSIQKTNKAADNNAAEDKEQITDNRVNIYKQKSHFTVKVKTPAYFALNENNPAIQKISSIKNTHDENITSTTAIVTLTDVANSQSKEAKAIKQDEPLAKTDSAKIKTETGKNITEKNKVTLSGKKQKESKNFANRLAFTLSAGADISYVAISNTGKLKPFYGTGLKYAVGKHFSISSGLYVSKKIYTATPAQYKFSGYANPALVKIDADCNIYEIPLTVYYNFKQVKNHNWFTGMGLSSYLMKKETYDYQYKTPTGQFWNYTHTYNNENKHYFSVLTLSGGYQYKLSNRVNLTAEPYLKLPLSGVGEGKIKLNSTGILVSAAIKPFVKQKKI